MTVGAVVHLVDDDASYLRALSRMLKGEGFAIAGFSSGSQLIAAVTPETRGCVVADLDMPGMSGLDLQASLAAAGVCMPVVFLSGHGNVSSTVRAMRQGAVDFIEKHAPREALLDAVRRALEQDAVECARRAQAADLKCRFEGLTRRELEVLAEVVAGLMNKQIAAKLGISERTVKMHRTAITTKVGVHSTARLATLAHDAGLFGPAQGPAGAGPTDR